MPEFEIYFEGYCPESILHGQQVEMRLNADDFWESEPTGLQIAVFPPYATILPWRGNGRFRASSENASDVLAGLLLTEGQQEEGKEFLPDTNFIIGNHHDLKYYLEGIYKDKKQFKESRFNLNDPVFEEQSQYLDALQPEAIHELVTLYNQLKAEDACTGEMYSDTFIRFHKRIYDLKLIFDFKWESWNKGWVNINNVKFDFASCSMLELSMYLTAIFRADRFSDGTIETNFRNGTLDKIFAAIKRYSKD